MEADGEEETGVLGESAAYCGDVIVASHESRVTRHLQDITPANTVEIRASDDVIGKAVQRVTCDVFRNETVPARRILTCTTR